MIDDILNYETLIELIIKENEFDDYKIYENKVVNSFIGNLLARYVDQPSNRYSFEKICSSLKTNINVVIPVYLKDCWIKLIHWVSEF